MGVEAGLNKLPITGPGDNNRWFIKRGLYFTDNYRYGFITFQDIMNYKANKKFNNTIRYDKFYLKKVFKYKLSNMIPRTHTERLAEKIVKDTIHNYKDEGKNSTQTHFC